MEIDGKDDGKEGGKERDALDSLREASLADKTKSSIVNTENSLDSLADLIEPFTSEREAEKIMKASPGRQNSSIFRNAGDRRRCLRFSMNLQIPVGLDRPDPPARSTRLPIPDESTTLISTYFGVGCFEDWVVIPNRSLSSSNLTL